MGLNKILPGQHAGPKTNQYRAVHFKESGRAEQQYRTQEGRYSTRSSQHCWNLAQAFQRTSINFKHLSGGAVKRRYLLPAPQIKVISGLGRPQGLGSRRCWVADGAQV